MSEQVYSGSDSLENLHEAVNYNNFLEKQLLRFIGPATQVLDFGAGNGQFASRLLARGKVVDCVEVDHGFSEKLRKDFRVFDSLAAAGMSYSRIYSLNVLEHIKDDVATLNHLHERLTADGRLFVYVPAFMLLYSDFDRKLGHFRRYRKGELRDKLAAAGFRIERLEYVDSGGMFAWLFLKMLKSGNAEPNRQMIRFYDRWLFPLSRVGDVVFKHLFGKNLLVIALKN